MAGDEAAVPAPDRPSPQLAEHARRIVEYYEGSWFDYRLLWTNRRHWAMHFGYEAPGARGHRQAVLALNRVMAEAAGVRPGDRVLDAGCGVGGSSLWLARTYGTQVTGVNIVASHIERARRHAGAVPGLAHPPRFEVADYAETPLADGSVDVVWAQESACHSPRKPAFLAEAARVLRPGGRIVLAEYVVNAAEATPAIKAWCDSWDMTLATDAAWRSWLVDAGFTDVVVRDETPHMRRSLHRLRRLCRTFRWGANVLHAVRLRSDAQQRNLAGGLHLWDALEAGDWFYALITATRADDPPAAG